jgi:FMN phosphatase YigB (HAD superfamily)
MYAHPLFLFDVDNTLFDNDRMQSDLNACLRDSLGESSPARYRQIYERRRAELGYADYLGSLQALREPGVNDLQLVRVTTFLMEYPFLRNVFPGVDAVLARAGQAVILSDGDVVFQPHKIRGAGLWHAVDGRVLIYTHKEKMLMQVASAYPARHYVMVDDKLRLLIAIKREWGDRVTTVFVRQGHYGTDAKTNASYPPADLTFDHIGQLVNIDLSG